MYCEDPAGTLVEDDVPDIDMGELDDELSHEEQSGSGSWSRVITETRMSSQHTQWMKMRKHKAVLLTQTHRLHLVWTYCWWLLSTEIFFSFFDSKSILIQWGRAPQQCEKFSFRSSKKYSCPIFKYKDLLQIYNIIFTDKIIILFKKLFKGSQALPFDSSSNLWFH